jgi:hypothetical protein
VTLRAIYNAIAAIPVGTIPCRNLDQIKLVVRAQDCPMRVLLPTTDGEMGFIAIGTMTNTPWLIRDLCLWQPLVAGVGIEQCAFDMVQYIEQYIAAMKGVREVVAGATLVSATFRLGPVAWATTDFWAVDITLRVEEILV